ncbi:ubiquitin-conjugating enzyme E2 [Microcoleus sp. AR_TQ3_B6]|uniref:hypothetical protein n=1 Tax=Microcoleus sp. AR_TQ3_B6 TaxID=3055284 RepID=UPI002FD43895
MSIRDDRLANDYHALQKLCAFNEPVKVKILEQRGTPPEYYRIQLSNCKGIEIVVGEAPKYRTEHIIVISNFPADYPDPGQLPTVQIESQIFHPNVYHNGLMDFGGSGLENISQPLDALVKRVILMIQYENLRFGLPSNVNARDWANKNKHLFPLSDAKPKLNWR